MSDTPNVYESAAREKKAQAMAAVARQWELGAIIIEEGSLNYWKWLQSTANPNSKRKSGPSAATKARVIEILKGGK